MTRWEPAPVPDDAPAPAGVKVATTADSPADPLNPGDFSSFGTKTGEQIADTEQTSGKWGQSSTTAKMTLAPTLDHEFKIGSNVTLTPSLEDSETVSETGVLFSKPIPTGGSLTLKVTF